MFGMTLPFSLGTDADRKSIMKIVLRSAAVNGFIEDYDLIKNKKRIFLLNDIRDGFIIKDIYMPSFKNVKIILATYSDIQREADKNGKSNKNGDFLYLRFTKFEILGDKAVIGIETEWAKPSKLMRLYCSGGGHDELFQKQNGKWKYVGDNGMWIS